MSNTFTAYGRLVSDPETRQIKGGGSSVTDFRFVSNRKKKGEEVPLWLSCYTFNNGDKSLGESVIQKYAKKGALVMVSGILEQEEYVDKDGNKRSSLKLELSNNGFTFVGGQSEGGGKQEGGTAPSTKSAPSPRQQSPAKNEGVDFSGADIDIPF